MGRTRRRSRASADNAAMVACARKVNLGIIPSRLATSFLCAATRRSASITAQDHGGRGRHRAIVRPCRRRLWQEAWLSVQELDRSKPPGLLTLSDLHPPRCPPSALATQPRASVVKWRKNHPCRRLLTTKPKSIVGVIIFDTFEPTHSVVATVTGCPCKAKKRGGAAGLPEPRRLLVSTSSTSVTSGALLTRPIRTLTRAALVTLLCPAASTDGCA